MIPEYKLYHGAVLAELVDISPRALSIDELREDGRLTSYVLDNRVGMQIKHSSARLRPWQFTFTKPNVVELGLLQFSHPDTYIVFVCHLDGLVCLTVEEVMSLLVFGASDQGWIRISRRRGEWYTVSGAAAELPRKKPEGIECILHCLNGEHGRPG